MKREVQFGQGAILKFCTVIYAKDPVGRRLRKLEYWSFIQTDIDNQHVTVSTCAWVAAALLTHPFGQVTLLSVVVVPLKLGYCKP